MLASFILLVKSHCQMPAELSHLAAAQVRAGVRAKVAASLQRVEALEAQLDGQAAAAAQLHDAHAAEAAALKQQAADAHAAGAATSSQLQTAQREAERYLNPKP